MSSTRNGTSKEELFFSEKKTWSTIKDQVLGTYIVPYLNKVARLRPDILIVDPFAGPGMFKDGTKGSPMILTDAAEQWARGRYQAIFGNLRQDHHDELTASLQRLIQNGQVRTFRGNANELLMKLHPLLRDRTLFLYLDPFGLKGCEFITLEPYLKRQKQYSTEILINIPPSAIHRLATRRAKLIGKTSSQLDSLNRRLTSVLGGGYWQGILDDPRLEPATKAELVVSGYQERLARHLPYTGACPVRERDKSAVKYYMTFCSRHPDSLLLFNDSMCAAYQEHLHEARTKGTLFEGSCWKNERNLRPLQGLVIQLLEALGREPRAGLWLRIVKEHFMEFTSSEYRAVVKELVDTGRVGFDDTKGTRRLNDLSVLYLTEHGLQVIRAPSRIRPSRGSTFGVSVEESASATDPQAYVRPMPNHGSIGRAS